MTVKLFSTNVKWLQSDCSAMIINETEHGRAACSFYVFDATQSPDSFFRANNALMTSYRYAIESRDKAVMAGWLTAAMEFTNMWGLAIVPIPLCDSINDATHPGDMCTVIWPAVGLLDKWAGSWETDDSDDLVWLIRDPFAKVWTFFETRHSILSIQFF